MLTRADGRARLDANPAVWLCSVFVALCGAGCCRVHPACCGFRAFL